jgi:hypothetical protein
MLPEPRPEAIWQQDLVACIEAIRMPSWSRFAASAAMWP